MWLHSDLLMCCSRDSVVSPGRAENWIQFGTDEQRPTNHRTVSQTFVCLPGRRGVSPPHTVSNKQACNEYECECVGPRCGYSVFSSIFLIIYYFGWCLSELATKKWKPDFALLNIISKGILWFKKYDPFAEVIVMSFELKSMCFCTLFILLLCLINVQYLY